MKNKLIITSVLLVVFVIGGILYYNNKSNQEKDNQNTTKTQSVKKKKVAFTIENHYDHLAIKAKDVDSVAICKLKSIDGVTNQNPKTKEYASINTYGVLEIEKTLKGKIDARDIDFIISGGTMKMSQYYNGLSKEEKEKFDLRAKYSSKEKEELFVKTYSDDVVNELDKNKSYLCYLKYNKDYKKYRLVSHKQNLREIKSGLKTEDIIVKNPDTNKYKIFTSFEELDAKLYDAVKQN